jgi:hypothetical protein
MHPIHARTCERVFKDLGTPCRPASTYCKVRPILSNTSAYACMDSLHPECTEDKRLRCSASSRGTIGLGPESGRPLSRQMPDRFQAEIDRIAMEHGLAGTDDYLNQWHWTAKLERPAIPPRFWTR